CFRLNVDGWFDLQRIDEIYISPRDGISSSLKRYRPSVGFDMSGQCRFRNRATHVEFDARLHVGKFVLNRNVARALDVDREAQSIELRRLGRSRTDPAKHRQEVFEAAAIGHTLDLEIAFQYRRIPRSSKCQRSVDHGPHTFWIPNSNGIWSDQQIHRLNSV